MLVLTRKNQEAVVVGSSDGLEPLLKVTVLDIGAGKVKLGFDADAKIPVHRLEVWERLQAGEQPDRLTRGPPPASTRTRNGSSPKVQRTRNGSSAKVERTGKLVILTFAGGKFRDQENMIASELEGHTEEMEECHLLLDFTNVEYLTSVELGTLVGLHKKMRGLGGRLTLFNLNPDIYEVFTVTRLQTLLGICR